MDTQSQHLGLGNQKPQNFFSIWNKKSIEECFTEVGSISTYGSQNGGCGRRELREGERGEEEMASAVAPTRSEVLSLFRSLMRTAREFTDYNVREYTKRRTVDAFRHNRQLSDTKEVAAAFADGKVQLGVAKRQAVVYSLYAPKIKSVMEI